MVLSTLCVVFICFFAVSESLYTVVEEGKTSCVSQELDNDDTALFRVAAIKTADLLDAASCLVKITDPDGSSIFESTLKSGEKTTDVKHNSKKRGPYSICFSSHANAPVRVFFNIDFWSRTISGGSAPTKVIKEELPGVEAQLMTVEESIVDISREIEFARKEEVLLREIGETTSDRIQWFGLLSVFVLLTISVWQVLYLRHFFTTKKLL